MRNPRENGVALITALLVLLLISSLIVGLTWLTFSDQKLDANYSARQSDFYVAESGLEDMTAQLATAFNQNYNLSTANINSIITNPLPLTNGYKFWDPNNPGNNGFLISYPQDPNNNGNPLASYHTILTGPYAGLVGLLTPYTLQVTSVSPFGSETKLQRTVQTAAIPVFQFGIFSDTDLSFFAGPDFDFGGRVHTNGNLWLAENGGTLTLENKVTAVGQIVRTNLENGESTSSAYNTTVNITTNPGSGSYRALATTEGTTTGTSYYGNVSTSYTPNWASQISVSDYNSNIGAAETGVTALNLGIATPSLGGQPIDLIRLPIPGESNDKLQERYYALASVRILVSDYGPSGSCADSDIMSLPEISSGTPVDLATLAWDTSATYATNANTGDSSSSAPPYKTYPSNASAAFVSAVGKTVFPLPVSAATSSTTYSSNNGYWQQPGFPIETGCLKIDYQSTAGGTFTDVTWQILALGYTGRNIEPLNQSGTGMPTYVAEPALPALPTSNAVYPGQGPTINTGVTSISCYDPSPKAVIRLARLRPNPTTYNDDNTYCGNEPNAKYTTGTKYPSTYGKDYWPNALFDTREGTLRDTGSTAGTNTTTGNPTPAGAMHYVELDVANLAAWVNSMNGAVNNVTGYTVYFSDRRGDQPDTQSPPPSEAGAISGKTGAYGYEDIVNSLTSPSSGCPNGTLEAAEDFEGDYTNGVDSSPVLKTYGNTLATLPSVLWPFKGTGSQIGTVSNLVKTVLAANGQCSTSGYQYPFAIASNSQDLRENPNFFFRRALKVVDGATLASGGTGIFGTCNGVNCGLSVVAENPIYVQGDYNDPTLDSTFASTDPHIACAVIGDAVTLLSDSWNDTNSFAYPYNPGNRPRANTMFRMAVVGGKGIPFKWPNGNGNSPQDFGTDGGMHNFLRYLEGGGNTIYYHGSVVSFYYSHQATGTYKCCTTVYGAPTRGYKFDSDFETPSLLPPRTPVLRNINTIGFTQVILPTQ
ncbi:MAG TPA: hypothetical protein VMU43_06650 [Candidatus Acidoferrum sp.]|nr:hypothetical protein [Candidatus Acidoferrum sp.]